MWKKRSINRFLDNTNISLASSWSRLLWRIWHRVITFCSWIHDSSYGHKTTVLFPLFFVISQTLFLQEADHRKNSTNRLFTVSCFQIQNWRVYVRSSFRGNRISLDIALSSSDDSVLTILFLVMWFVHYQSGRDIYTSNYRCVRCRVFRCSVWIYSSSIRSYLETRSRASKSHLSVHVQWSNRSKIIQSRDSKLSRTQHVWQDIAYSDDVLRFRTRDGKYTSVLMTMIIGSLDIRSLSCILHRSVSKLTWYDKITKSIYSIFTYDILYDTEIKRKYHSKIAEFESCHL